MTINEYNPNPWFQHKDYKISADCQGKEITDLVTGRSWHELFDGDRWWCVPPEVFNIWLNAYDLGKKSSVDKD